MIVIAASFLKTLKLVEDTLSCRFKFLSSSSLLKIKNEYLSILDKYFYPRNQFVTKQQEIHIFRGHQVW